MRRNTGLRVGIGLGVLASLVLGVAAAAPAQAVERAGDVYAALPLPVHINGKAVEIKVGGDLTANDDVTVTLRNARGAYLDTAEGVYAGVSPLVLKAHTTQVGTWQADITRVTQPCAHTGYDVVLNCEQDYSYGPWYEVVTGLTPHPSQTVVAKYDARVQLARHVTGHGTHRVVIYRAHVTHYTRDNGWVTWAHAPISVNGQYAVTNAHGNVALNTRGSHSPRYTIKTFTTKSIWTSTTHLLIP